MENSISYAIIGSLIGILGMAIGVYFGLKKEPNKRKEITIMATTFTLIVLAHCCIQIVVSAPWKVYAAIVYGVVLVAFIFYWKRKASRPDWNDSATRD